MTQVIADEIIINLSAHKGLSNNSTFLSDISFQTNGILKKDSNILYSDVSVLSCQIPVSFYTVNYSNNTLKYTYNSNNYSIQIPVGNYNSLTLINVLQSLFGTNGQSMSINLNNNTCVLSFSSNNPFSFLSSSTCLVILGFTTNISSISNSIIMPYPMNTLGITKLKICSNKLPVKNHDSVGNVLAIIAVNQPSYSLITWENSALSKYVLTTDTVNNIDIQIYDQYDNLVNFNNIPWDISLRITSYRLFIPSPSTFNSIIQNT